ncbi:MAG: 3,4-dihydroxy-2-butanone-4-phosphate synthase [Candidatus Pelagibacter sp. TMED165]|nr:MAG: 3,4-dihydroxy-2-butanone-4-phosphate synthase [Candidatus Pelagibacter sp. TMED165]|tara:strand:+ start:619 stop:1680 length:1062 start_codon:yes stop_codon:yes gene_type:complete
MKKNLLSPIKEILKDAKKGKMFILVDDKDRENEGDLIIPASKCNSKSINFMAKHGRGLICLALEKKQVDKLSLPLMSSVNKSRMHTAFTVSIESKKGITTGISAFDRAKTIKVAINSKSKKKDIVSPGHVFPLVARNGGVLERAGHTEASVDISKLAKLNPSAVICEVMNEDGRMARLKDLKPFSEKHKIKIASIEDLIAYRLRNENLISKGSTKIFKNKRCGKYEFITYENKLDNSNNFVIKKGNFNLHKKVIRIRVISAKLKNSKSILKDARIKNSFNYLSKYPNFALILINNSKTDNSEKDNVILRYYGIGAQIIKDLKVKKMVLVTRKRKKIIGLEGFGLKIKKQEIIR